MGVRAKIIKILSPSEFIINKGTADGLKKGAKLSIIGKEIPISDLDGADLGMFVYSKGELYARDVHEKFAYCRTGTRVESRNLPSPLFSATPAYMFGTRTVSEEVTIELDVDPDAECVSVSPVAVGDEVVEVSSSDVRS